MRVFRVADSDKAYSICHKSTADLAKLDGSKVRVSGKLVSCDEGQELMIDKAAKILSRRSGEDMDMTFIPPDEGPLHVLTPGTHRAPGSGIVAHGDGPASEDEDDHPQSTLPPFTFTTSPVMCRAQSEQRNAMGPAMSRGCATRPIGMPRSMHHVVLKAIK